MREIEQIDRNFELKKQELIRQNEQDIQLEEQKWQKYKQEQEKKIRDEIEHDIDLKIAQFKDQLKRDEDREIRRIEDESKQQLKDFENELNNKMDQEKQNLIQYYERIRKTVKESE